MMTRCNILFTFADSTANCTHQNSLETQVVNQCSRAIVRNAISKVTMCPVTQNKGNNQSFTSFQQDNDVEKNKLSCSNNNSDVQSEFIDKSAIKFLDSICKRDENEVKYPR